MWLVALVQCSVDHTTMPPLLVGSFTDLLLGLFVHRMLLFVAISGLVPLQVAMQASPEKVVPDGVGKLDLFADDHEFHVPTLEFVKPGDRGRLGPATQWQRLDWSGWMWEHMYDDERHRLVRNLGTGIWNDHFVGMATDYKSPTKSSIPLLERLIWNYSCSNRTVSQNGLQLVAHF